MPERPFYRIWTRTTSVVGPGAGQEVIGMECFVRSDTANKILAIINDRDQVASARDTALKTIASLNDKITSMTLQINDLHMAANTAPLAPGNTDDADAVASLNKAYAEIASKSTADTVATLQTSAAAKPVTSGYVQAVKPVETVAPKTQTTFEIK